jgi:hypothetical protein
VRKLRGLGPSFGPGLEPGALFAYADPPYVGLSARFYRDEPSFNGEVDHRQLLADLERAGYAGWALSCSVKSLRVLLPMCPAGVRVCAWVKPIGVPPATFGIHGTWEAVVVRGGRQCRPGVRDWLSAQPARLGGELPGRKPIAFCAWLFDLLGMVPGDLLADLFPGSGAVGQAWEELSRGAEHRAGDKRRLFLPSRVEERVTAFSASPRRRSV